jgi:hypothetical protein
VARINISISHAIISKGREECIVRWSKGESFEHWALKVAGVIELLRQGFKAKDIEVEKVFSKIKLHVEQTYMRNNTRKGKEGRFGWNVNPPI